MLGVSRTSKTPTSIYLANKGFKISNIPLVNEKSIPEILKEKPNLTCVVGLNTEPERLADIRKNRMNSLKESQNKSYTDLSKIKKEVNDAKNTFKKYIGIEKHVSTVISNKICRSRNSRIQTFYQMGWWQTKGHSRSRVWNSQKYRALL